MGNSLNALSVTLIRRPEDRLGESSDAGRTKVICSIGPEAVQQMVDQACADSESVSGIPDDHPAIKKGFILPPSPSSDLIG